MGPFPICSIADTCPFELLEVGFFTALPAIRPRGLDLEALVPLVQVAALGFIFLGRRATHMLEWVLPYLSRTTKAGALT